MYDIKVKMNSSGDSPESTDGLVGRIKACIKPTADLQSREHGIFEGQEWYMDVYHPRGEDGLIGVRVLGDHVQVLASRAGYMYLTCIKEHVPEMEDLPPVMVRKVIAGSSGQRGHEPRKIVITPEDIKPGYKKIEYKGIIKITAQDIEEQKKKEKEKRRKIKIEE